ncbi:MAG: SusC/RagA family TonB-linked outer membrane protein [Marinilabiliaceae bacterium]|nr:SusC/RagA family TonB-linked outer membrane protein [Marinilabiliaceae bacterium]
MIAVLWMLFQMSVWSSVVEDKLLTLRMKDVTVEQVINKVEQISDYTFLFNSEVLDVKRKVSVNWQGKGIREALASLFEGSYVQYVISGNQIVLSKKKKQRKEVKLQRGFVQGLITDEKGEPIIGVTIVVKDNLSVGTISDFNGHFRLDITDPNVLLKVSFIGFKPMVIEPDFAKDMRIVLKSDTENLEEIVVTAMGIERKAKSLTYSTQTIKNKELTRAKNTNFMNSLQGKSAGLTITPNSSGAGGGSSKILLRGQSSMLGNNQPLIVLDGIPLSNGMSGQTQSLQYSGASDGGDLLSTINPDDIASMSILKGANAAALYGSAANNGVILITTKSGREGKPRVDVSSSVTVESPLILPELQKEYGGNISNGYKMNFDGWGKKISEFTDEEINRLPYATRNTRDNIKDFFVLGLTCNNSVSINAGTEFNKSYFSYGNTYQQGLTPNNKFNRHNILFKQSFAILNKKLKLDLSINYIHQKTENTPSIGKGLNPLYGLYRTPANVDMRYFKNNYQHIARADDDMVLGNPASTNKKLEGHNVQSWPWFTQHNNNPFWMINKRDGELVKDRVLSSVTANADIVNEVLSVQGRLSIDSKMNKSKAEEYATLNRETRGLGGKYFTGRGNRSDVFADILTTLNKKVNGNIEINTTVGASTKRIKDRYFGVTNPIDTAAMPNVFVPQNNRRNLIESSAAAYETWSSDWEAAVFATAQLGYKDMAYIDMSFRNDWAKAFQQFADKGKYKSFPYFSFGANMQLQQIVPKLKRYVNYLKLRASYSEVGNSIPNSIYRAQNIDFGTGAISARAPSFDNPKPETTKAIEFGMEGAVLNNKLDFDIALYQTTMENQFLRYSTPSGQLKPINSGKVQNRGLEVSIGYMVFNNNNWRWKSGLNFSYNDNTILTTYKPANGKAQKIELGDAAFKIKFIEGGSFGDLYVNSFMKDDKGHIQIDSQGAPMMATGTFETFVGNATAKMNFGWNNTLAYKNFNFYMLIDGKIGGKVMSLTEADFDRFGLSQRTADARNKGGKVTLPDGTGRQVDAKAYYSKIGENPMEDYVYNATNLRFRELSLGYSLRDLLGANKDVSISLVARNIGFLYKDAPIDPDISMSSANGFGGIDVYALPATRTLGVNVKLTF